MSKIYNAQVSPPHLVDVTDTIVFPRDSARLAVIGSEIYFSENGIGEYFFSEWDSTFFDLMVIAGAVEFCDLIHRRPSLGWARNFDLSIAVHDPAKWRTSAVTEALGAAVGFLTGDVWKFCFTERRRPMARGRQLNLSLPHSAIAVIPYSEGLDSRAVAAIHTDAGSDKAILVRLGSGGVDGGGRTRKPFWTVPYAIKVEKHERRETSARSRGFKFAVITGIAAHLAKIPTVIVTESGQGALGPSLTTTGHSYPDYRVHPSFTHRVEELFEALLGSSPRFTFPRLWSTKGETLATAARLKNPPSWSDARSCWQGNRQVSVNGKRRQCGICAACMLRRMSMFSAGLVEPVETYVWESLSTSTMRDGAANGFVEFTRALDQYAVAGVLHLDHLATLADAEAPNSLLRRTSREVARATGEHPVNVEANLLGLLKRHQQEWRGFTNSLGPESFVNKLIMRAP